VTAARLRPAAIVLTATLLLALLPLAQGAEAVPNNDSPVFINELHYDNAGTDAGEFVEVVATDGTDASGYSIVLYNGSGGATYDSDALGPLAATASGVNYYTVEYPTNGIQNGAPDGIALSDTSGALVQFLSYEGSLTASDGPANGQASTDIGVEEGSSTPAGQSLQLGGSGTTYGDFAWAAPADDTPGAANNSQTFGTGGGGGEPEPEPVRIREIQGDGHISPLLGEQVADVPGIVTARKRNGFYLQDVREIETTRASDGALRLHGLCALGRRRRRRQ
jgi:predicted extracellular nuclease